MWFDHASLGYSVYGSRRWSATVRFAFWCCHSSKYRCTWGDSIDGESGQNRSSVNRSFGQWQCWCPNHFPWRVGYVIRLRSRLHMLGSANRWFVIWIEKLSHSFHWHWGRHSECSSLSLTAWTCDWFVLPPILYWAIVEGEVSISLYHHVFMVDWRRVSYI